MRWFTLALRLGAEVFAATPKVASKVERQTAHNILQMRQPLLPPARQSGHDDPIQIPHPASDLLEVGETLRTGGPDGYARDHATMQLCSGWLTSVQNIVHLILPNFMSAYRLKVDRLAVVERSFRINLTVGELVEVLKSLIADVDAGLLTSIVDSAQAEVFDEFLDHAAEYVRRQRKQEGGAIAGVVFEDTLRRICRRLSIPEAGVKLDQLISVLASKDVLTSVKAKRARAAADLRTRATHAQWDEYELKDVEATIQTTRELIDAHLDGASHP